MAESIYRVVVAISALDAVTDWLVLPSPGEYFVSVHVRGSFAGTLTPQLKSPGAADADAVDDTADAITAANHYNFVLHGPACLRLKATAWTSGQALGEMQR